MGSYRPLQSLNEGHWFKLICGASFSHLPAVRNLALAYAIAGADCIDVAADPAVIAAAREGLQASKAFLQSTTEIEADPLPLLMVSLNDGEDPHFRKAFFDPSICPSTCSRPCESICPTGAIAFPPGNNGSGVIENKCYGCGRCLPICPIQQIETHSYLLKPSDLAPLILDQIDAIEIHTQPGHYEGFRALWQTLQDWVPHLKLLSISCPDGDGLIDYLQQLCHLIQPLPIPLIWQIDGRPMSGDIGTGTTRATIKLGQKILCTGIPGHLQLAGGTNQHTVPKLKQLGLLNTLLTTENRKTSNLEPSSSPQPVHPPYISGVAYGSYARMLLAPTLNELEGLLPIPTFSPNLEENRQIKTPEKLAHSPYSTVHLNPLSTQLKAPPKHHTNCLENHPDLMKQTVFLARELVCQLKCTVRQTPLHISAIKPEQTKINV